jgi:FkbM family methyltransferase
MNSTPLYDIWRLLSYPRVDCEAEIRALCRTAYLGNDTTLCRVLGRYKMFVDTRDIGISSHLMLDGFWEMWVTEAMMRAVRRGATVIDVGANLGYFTLLLADLTGPEGQVLSFEPNPVLASRLRQSVEVNGFAPYTHVHEMGLGGTEGHASLDVDQSQPGGGRVVPTDSSGATPRVIIRRLDEIPGALDAEFIKIDVEGYEEHVWDGMAGILARRRPLTIFMEFTVSRYANPRAFLERIMADGFPLEIIDFSGEIVPITIEEVFARPHSIDHMLAFRRR